jgi:hypothetical protein
MQNTLDGLRSHLQVLLSLATQGNPDGQQLQGQFLPVQQYIQQQVLPLGDTYPGAQPVLTELNRTLRLLAMDIAFLQTARQPLTVQQRQSQLAKKIRQMLDYCGALEAAQPPPDLAADPPAPP